MVVIDCTQMGFSPPKTLSPTFTSRVLCRRKVGSNIPKGKAPFRLEGNGGADWPRFDSP